MTDPVTIALASMPAPQGNLTILSERFQPRNLTELCTWSDLVIQSGLALKGQNRAAIVICVQMGAAVGIDPAQAIQNICVINGKPSIYGDLGLAIFQRDAKYKSFNESAPSKALEQGFGWCRIEMRDGQIVERTFSIDEAKTARLWSKDGPWQQYPGRMLMFRARWWAMRDSAPGVFKGLYSREEAEDIVDAETREPARSMPRALDAPPLTDAIVSSLSAAQKSAPQPGPTVAPQTTQPAGKKTDAAPAAPMVWKGVLASGKIASRSKTDEKKVWELHVWTAKDGTEFKTFDKEISAKAKNFASAGDLLAIEYTIDDRGGKVIVTISPAQKPPPAVEKTETLFEEPGSGG